MTTLLYHRRIPRASIFWAANTASRVSKWAEALVGELRIAPCRWQAPSCRSCRRGIPAWRETLLVLPVAVSFNRSKGENRSCRTTSLPPRGGALAHSSAEIRDAARRGPSSRKRRHPLEPGRRRERLSALASEPLDRRSDLAVLLRGLRALAAVPARRPGRPRRRRPAPDRHGPAHLPLSGHRPFPGPPRPAQRPAHQPSAAGPGGVRLRRGRPRPQLRVDPLPGSAQRHPPPAARRPP